MVDWMRVRLNDVSDNFQVVHYRRILHLMALAMHYKTIYDIQNYLESFAKLCNLTCVLQ